MQPLKELGLLALLAAYYFFTVLFAVAALAPRFSLQAGFIAAALSMIAYLVLWVTKQDKLGNPLRLLILLPVIWILAGVLWWIMRLLFGFRLLE